MILVYILEDLVRTCIPSICLHCSFLLFCNFRRVIFEKSVSSTIFFFLVFFLARLQSGIYWLHGHRCAWVFGQHTEKQSQVWHWYQRLIKHGNYEWNILIIDIHLAVYWFTYLLIWSINISAYHEFVHMLSSNIIQLLTFGFIVTFFGP